MLEMDPSADPANSISFLEKAVREDQRNSYANRLDSIKTQQRPWFEIRVFYLRVNSCPLDEAPEWLTMQYCATNFCTAIEVNGGRIPPCGDTCLTLRRDRIDKGSAEVTYVNTDNIRTTGPLCFKVYDKSDVLLFGRLERIGSSDDGGIIELRNVNLSKSSNPQVEELKSAQLGWRLECSCGITSSKCSLARSVPNFSGVSCPPPSVEVFLAGRVCGMPVILTEAVKLIARRKHSRHETMHAIPEDEETEAFMDRLGKDECSEWPEPLSAGLNNIYSGPDDRFFEDDGQLSWFKAGVRVGVGIGLSMCLGLGLGIGVLVRTYQSTSRPFKMKPSSRRFCS